MKQDADHTCHVESVTSGGFPSLAFVEQHEFRVVLDRVPYRRSLAGVQFTRESHEQIVGVDGLDDEEAIRT